MIIFEQNEFLFVKKSTADSAEFRRQIAIKGTHFLLEHNLDEDVIAYIRANCEFKARYNINIADFDFHDYRVYTFFKKFGTGKGSMENDCLRFAESLAIGKYPYRGTRSFMKDNITENLLGESHERNFQIANDVYEHYSKGIPSTYNGLDVEHNINNYANPEIGECYGMLSLWSPDASAAAAQMPYHFACVIFKDITNDSTTNITVEANVSDVGQKMPAFQMYDVNDFRNNYSFHDSWLEYFSTSQYPEFKINRILKKNKKGETVVTRDAPPTTRADEYYDEWGFLVKNDQYVMKKMTLEPITIVAVPKDKRISQNLIIPAAFEKHSKTPVSPASSVITSPEKMHYIATPPSAASKKSHSRKRKRTAAAPTAATRGTTNAASRGTRRRVRTRRS